MASINKESTTPQNKGAKIEDKSSVENNENVLSSAACNTEQPLSPSSKPESDVSCNFNWSDEGDPETSRTNY